MTQTFLSFSNFLGEGVSVQTRNGYRQHEVPQIETAASRKRRTNLVLNL